MSATATAALPSGETQQTQTTDTTQSTQQTQQTTQATDAAAGTQTVATTQTAEQVAQQKWGDAWRKDYAGEDAKMLARLERYQSPKAALDALIAAQNKISAGELVKPLPDNPTAEELTAWRTQNGIPEKAEGYLEKLPDGIVVGEDDKPILNSFLERIHKMNADPKLAQEAVKWYYDFQEEQVAARTQKDASDKQSTEDALRADMGADYRANINQIQSFLSSLPTGVGEMLANARNGEGKALFNDPSFVNAMAGLARELNPAGVIVGGIGNGSGIVDELATIEKMMGNKNSDYWKGSKAESLQARYRDLITAKEQLDKRGR